MSIRLGFLGAGGIARVHAEAAKAAGATIAGFFDVVPERARDLAEAHDGAIATTSAGELLALAAWGPCAEHP